MHPRISVIDLPLLACVALSIAIHAALLYTRGLYTPPAPHFEPGRTVMKLTLTPSAPSRAAAPEPAAVQPVPVPAVQPVVQSRPEPRAEQQTVDAAEQDASLIEDKGVVTEASAASLRRPAYPRISRLRGEEGVVTLSIEVLASGKAGKVEVVQSSGYRRLDEAARKAALGSTYTPARLTGRAVDSVVELSFTFRLTDD